jgi:hypothetical protein
METRENIREAIKKYGPITDRFILRLGKSEEEAGKFESWHSNLSTFAEDFNGYLACLRLTRLVDSVEERMKGQKSIIRAVKKEQRQTAKAIQKEADKLQKALDKAAKKVEREAEKQKIKAEAKIAREAAKAAKKAGVLECTSTEVEESVVTKSDTTPQVNSSTSNPKPPLPETPQPELTTSTEVLVPTVESSQVIVEALVHPPAPNEALKAAVIRYETEVQVPTFKLPMEG